MYINCDLHSPIVNSLGSTASASESGKCGRKDRLDNLSVMLIGFIEYESLTLCRLMLNPHSELEHSRYTKISSLSDYSYYPPLNNLVNVCWTYTISSQDYSEEKKWGREMVEISDH
jgi:hypothetical protein